MPTPTYTLLDSVTLASSAASVTFSSIDQSYGDLVLVVEASSNSSAAGFYGRYNGDTGDNYHTVFAYGNGSSTSSGTRSPRESIYDFGYHATSGGNAVSIIQIMDYSATDKHKSALHRNNDASERTYMVASRWANTAAITSITMYLFSTWQFESGSTFRLYGIAKAL